MTIFDKVDYISFNKKVLNSETVVCFGLEACVNSANAK